MEKKIKHLEMIQDIISRMASNSFMLKGWAVTLVAGMFVLASRDASWVFFCLAYIPIIMFWLLDSYYLQQERLFRSLYDKIRKTNENDIDFSMKATLNEFNSGRNSYNSCLKAPTEMSFYVTLAIVCAIVIVLSIYM